MKSVVLIASVVLFWVCFLTALTSSVDHNTKALETQCDNTAKTIEASIYDFDQEHNKCNIVTQDGKLVSF